MTDVNVSYDSEDNIRNDSNAGKIIRPVERQGSSVEGPPPPPPPPLQPAVVVPNLEMEFPSPPRFGLNVMYRATQYLESYIRLTTKQKLCHSIDSFY